MYQIQITKIEPRTEEEMKLRRERDMQQGGRNGFRPSEFEGNYPNGMSRDDFKTVKVLDVELSEEEFKAVKKAVIDVM